MQLMTIDFETAYGRSPSGRKVTLSSMTTEEYVRDREFKVHCVGVKLDDTPSECIEGPEIQAYFGTVDWGNTAVLAHHAHFDGAILNWIYGYKPKFWLDTLSMANAMFPWMSSSLDALSQHYGVGDKGKELVRTINKWELDEETMSVLMRYCNQDVELTYAIFQKMRGALSQTEMRLIDQTVRLFTEPVIEVDTSVLVTEYKRELQGKRDLLRLVAPNKKDLMSNDKFAKALQAIGVDPPKKISPRTGKVAWAFAKGDELFKNLLTHEREDVRTLVEARIGVKTTIKETRTRRFYDIGKRGKFPVYLKYYGAHSGRFSGGDKINAQNMPRYNPADPLSGALRRSWVAPEGHVFVVSDLSQIECLHEDSLVLTRDRGYIKIQHITKQDLLWDGLEWVAHDGAIPTGIKEVITYDGITATPDHIVYLTDGRSVQLSDAKKEGATLAVGELCGETVRYVGGAGQTNTALPESSALVVPVYPPSVWHNETCQSTRPPKREITKLREAPQGERLLRIPTEGDGNSAPYPIQPNPGIDRPEGEESLVCFVPEAGNTEQIQLNGGVCSLHGGESPAPYVCRGGDRSDRQRRSLRTGEHTTSNSHGECTKQTQQCGGDVQRGKHECNDVYSGARPEVSSVVSASHVAQRSHTRDDCRSSDSQTTRGDELQKANVYDIINAGPRNRFTVNGKIVSNCRMLAYWAGQDDLVEAFRQRVDPYCHTASGLYGREITKAAKAERQVGKAVTLGCIAEGQLVLTDKGLVPIEEVSIDMRVWDGLEWVRHKGVIYQGEKEVIEYLGLQATPDHVVFDQNRMTLTFGEAAGKGVDLDPPDVSGALALFGIKLGKTTKNLGVRRTYDIANAGRRHRFTVSGKLVHNCGYGMGWLKFQESLRIGFLGMPSLIFDDTYANTLGVDVKSVLMTPTWFGDSNRKTVLALAEESRPALIDKRTHYVHCAVTKAIIDRYRQTNPAIVALWYAAQKAFNSILSGDRTVIGQHHLVHTTTKGMQMPNGMQVQYHNLRKEKNEWKYLSNEKRKEWTYIYSGKCVENLVQGMARIILAEQILGVAKKYRVVSSTHDEIICIVPEAEGAAALSYMKQVMSTPPEWAPDLPLSAEGGFNKSYGLCDK